MPYIKVDVDRINEYQKSVYSARNRVQSITSDFSSIGYNIDSDIKDCSDIRRKIERINSSLSDFNLLLVRMNSFLGNTSLKYLNAEKQFGGNANIAENYYNITNIDELANTIANKANLDVSDVTNAIVSGEYSLEEIVKYAGGISAGGAFSAHISDLSIKHATTQKTQNSVGVSYTEAEKQEIISIAATELGISEEEIHDGIEQDLYKISDIFEYLDGKAKETNDFVKNVNKVVKASADWLKWATGSTNVLFKIRDGYVIVSEFTRNGRFNDLLKAFNSRGVGTRWRWCEYCTLTLAPSHEPFRR